MYLGLNSSIASIRKASKNLYTLNVLLYLISITVIVVKIRVVSSREEIDSLSPREKMVHLAFRASNVDFVQLMQRCPRLQAVQMPPSYQKTMSNALSGFLQMQGVDLIEGDVWGHRKDIDEYFTVPEETVATIRSMTEKGITPEETAKEVRKTAKLGDGLIRYIARTNATA